jgi:hypothetical protein
MLHLLVHAIDAMSEMPIGYRELLATSERLTEMLSDSSRRRSDHQEMAVVTSSHVLLSVHDSGPGLDQTNLNRPFRHLLHNQASGSRDGASDQPRDY